MHSESRVYATQFLYLFATSLANKYRATRTTTVMKIAEIMVAVMMVSLARSD